jgi:hypothetical protein
MCFAEERLVEPGVPNLSWVTLWCIVNAHLLRRMDQPCSKPNIKGAGMLRLLSRLALNYSSRRNARVRRPFRSVEVSCLGIDFFLSEFFDGFAQMCVDRGWLEQIELRFSLEG